MSNRRKANQASEWVNANDGLQLPGGCDHCDSYATVTSNKWGPDMHAMTIFHDDDCPYLTALPN